MNFPVVFSLPSRLGVAARLAAFSGTWPRMDLLPIPIADIEDWIDRRISSDKSFTLPDNIAAGTISAQVELLAMALNYLGGIGWEDIGSTARARAGITAAQKSVLEHLFQSAIQFVSYSTDNIDIATIQEGLRPWLIQGDSFIFQDIPWNFQKYSQKNCYS